MRGATVFVFLIHFFHILPQVVYSLLITEIHCNLKSANLKSLFWLHKNSNLIICTNGKRDIGKESKAKRDSFLCATYTTAAKQPCDLL